MRLAEVAKAVVAGSTALGTWGYTALADGAIQAAEWFGLTGVAVAFFGTWAKSNSAPPREP